VVPSVVGLSDLARRYSRDQGYPFQEMATELLVQISKRWSNYLPHPADGKVKNPTWLVCAVIDPYNAPFLQKADLLESSLTELRRWVLRDSQTMEPDSPDDESLPTDENLVPAWMDSTNAPPSATTNSTATNAPPSTFPAASDQTQQLLVHIRRFCDIVREGGPTLKNPDYKFRGLKWWLASAPNLSRLQPSALRLLTLGATSSDCESVFSTAAWHLSGNKRSANGQNLDARVFLSFNWNAIAAEMQQ
jgi:hypothetical protein